MTCTYRRASSPASTRVPRSMMVLLVVDELVGVTGIAPAASRSRTERSTPELHPVKNQSRTQESNLAACRRAPDVVLRRRVAASGWLRPNTKWDPGSLVLEERRISESNRVACRHRVQLPCESEWWCRIFGLLNREVGAVPISGKISVVARRGVEPRRSVL